MKTPTPIPSCPLLSLENSISLFLFSRLFFFFLSRRCFHFVEVDSVAFFPPRDGNPSPSLARLPDGKLHCFLPRLATFFHECSRWMDSFRRVLLATGFAPPRRVYVLFTRRCWSDYFSELVFLGIFRIYIERKCKYKVSRICLWNEIHTESVIYTLYKSLSNLLCK